MCTWKDKIGNCFGIEDLKFANHPLDQKNAKEMLIEAFSESVGFEEFCHEIENWLINKLKGENPSEIKDLMKKEMEKVKDLKSYFTKD